MTEFIPNPTSPSVMFCIQVASACVRVCVCVRVRAYACVCVRVRVEEEEEEEEEIWLFNIVCSYTNSAM